MHHFSRDCIGGSVNKTVGVEKEEGRVADMQTIGMQCR